MIRVGASKITINGKIGSQIQGAAVDNVADYIRDDLEANALICSDGKTQVMLVSCDIAGLLPEYTEKAAAEMADRAGIDKRDIIIACTHTHSGPSVIPTNPSKELDIDYLDLLHDRLVTLAEQTVKSMAPARVGWQAGSVRIGYNRRFCWEDGSHSMHGDPRKSGFTGLEGPDDPHHVALLFLQAQENVPIALLHANTGHPTNFYGKNFYSADFPGAARTYLREALGEDLPVLYLNGAFGDIERFNDLSRYHYPETPERNMLRMAHLVAGETLRCMHEMPICEISGIGHEYEDMKADVRLPAVDRLAWAQDVMDRYEGGVGVDKWERMFAFGITSLQKQFGENPVDALPIHAIRIGQLALLTQPCEMFCQFGLDIKRRSPAAATAVGGISDGYRGYLPSTQGIIGGGYSGEPIFWTRYTAETGYLLVDAASKLLRRLWN